MIVIRDNQQPLGSVKTPNENAPTVAAAEAHEKTGRKTDTRILHQERPSEKEFSTVRARFAFSGHTLFEEVHRGTNIRLWSVSRWGQTRVFSCWPDVRSFLVRIGG